MKKVFSIIVFLLCAFVCFGVNYASPYKGAGRSGYVYATSAVHGHGISTGIAQAPTASMGSTSSFGARTMSTTVEAVSAIQTIRTSASTVSGGVTAAQTYARIGGPKKSQAYPGVPDCPQCIDEDGDDVCDKCGCDLFDGCTCAGESGYCWCPIDLDWTVFFFFAVLMTLYFVFKTQKSEAQNIIWVILGHF